MKTKELAEKMKNDILESLQQQDNPVGILLDMYIERQLEKFENAIRTEIVEKELEQLNQEPKF